MGQKEKKKQQAAAQKPNRTPMPRHPRGHGAKVTAEIVVSLLLVAFAGYEVYRIYDSMVPIAQGSGVVAGGDSDEAAQLVRQVREALRTLPFFPGRKVVWMKNCNFLGDSVTGRSSTTEAALDSFRQLLESGLGPDVLLLISASEFDKRRSFNKFLLQYAASEELN